MVRTTPNDITELPDNGVFVFGSNAQGSHGGGAALVAQQRFGAVTGIGEGLQGQSYALPTMEGIEALEMATQRFVAFAEQHPELDFYLTKVGCGIAGYREDEVAPFFRDAPPNVIKPPGW
jgi:hypothetical protein